MQDTPKIIFEDDSLMVLDKPSGWISNNAGTTTTQPVVQSWLAKTFKYPLVGNYEYRDGIVHRLDKETSGLLLVAKTKEAFENLQSQFKKRIVKKSYLALVHGKMEGEGEISATVGRLPWRRDRFGVIPDGRESQTHYKVVKFYKGNNGGCTLVEFFPKTGRTHQIRIHARHVGHAIVADEFYAGRKTARNDRKWCPRLFLHAHTIEFIHPDTNKVISFTSPLPEVLADILNVL